MTTHTIKFTDTDNYLKATIDKQTLDIDVKKIIKLPTYINVLNTLDTALNNDIQIKASLYATDDEDTINIIKGNVSISILDKNMSLLYQHIVSFDKQYILDNIVNNFDFGEYYLKIEYFGNQYYLPCEYLTSFTISKRYINYNIFADNVYGYPNENIDFTLKLYDFQTNRPVSCDIKYTINGLEYFTSTDESGIAILHVTVPDINPDKCHQFLKQIQNTPQEMTTYTEEEYYNDEGNIRILKSFNVIFDDMQIDADHKGYIFDDNEEILWFDQAYYKDMDENYLPEYDPDNIINDEIPTNNNQYLYGYPIEIEIIDDIYYRENIIQYIYANKINTQIGISIIKNNNGITTIEGNIIGSNNTDVQYGIISLSIRNNDVVSSMVDKNGHFILEWETNNIFGNENNNIDNYTEYSYALNKRNVNLTITQDSTNEYQVGHTLRFIAQVTTQGDNKPIVDGMVFFTIHDVNKNNNEIYRLPTELNNNGEAMLLFDVSTAGKYYVQAHYCGIFEYLDADSDTINYTITK